MKLKTALRFVAGMLGVAVVLTNTGSVESRSKSSGPHDIYLTDDRVCKACTGRWISNHQVALTNRQGERAIVESREIVGIDNHPVVRKVFRDSLHGIGLSAQVVVPYAFDDWEQFVCKYCKEFDPPR